METSVRPLALLLVTAMLLSACGALELLPTPSPTVQETAYSSGLEHTLTATPAPSPTPDVVSGTIWLWHSWGESQMPVLEEILRSFQREYPDVLFDVLYVPVEDVPGRFAASAAEGSAPTLLLGPSESGRELADEGLLADVSVLLPPEAIAALNPAALEAGRYGDFQRGLPYSMDGVVLFRNTRILPQPADNLDEMGELAEAATQGEITGAVLERSFFYAVPHLYGIGGMLMHQDGTPAFSGDRGVAWLELLRSFDQIGATTFYSDADRDRFVDGRAGWIFAGTWHRGDFTDSLGAESLAIDPWPSHAGGRLSGFVQAEQIYWNADAPEDVTRATAAFVEYFLSPPVLSRLVDARRIPALIYGAAEPYVEDPLLLQALVALEDGVAYPARDEIDAYPGPVDIALRAVFEGGIAPEEALEQAQDQTLARLEALGSLP